MVFFAHLRPAVVTDLLVCGRTRSSWGLVRNKEDEVGDRKAGFHRTHAEPILSFHL